jgi:hypothetical protein
LFVAIKGGSNVYYSHTYSAIYLPPSNSGIEKVVDDILNNEHTMVSNLLYQDEDGTTLKTVLRSRPEVTDSGYNAEEVYNKIVERLQGSENQETGPDEIKREEYNYLVNSKNIQDPKLNTTTKDIGDYKEGKFLKQYFDRIILLNRLKETQVLTGFSRFEPSMSDSNRREKMRMLKGDDPNWLPGKENYGEGIFIQFNQKKLEEWHQRFNNSFSGQIARYNSSDSARKDETYTRLPYIMLHTFAHLLIKRLCFKCGYGSSSLKERIYYESPNDNPGNPMAGILIYTASAGAEGSMGGLVRQGQEDFLGETVLEAISEAEWCSADPVCTDIGQNSGQGPANVNGSACHNCCLLPETSCEQFNILLDRATISGTFYGKPGFFADHAFVSERATENG